MSERQRTVSEEQFERYLLDCGLDDFQHEPDLQGATSHPNYVVHVGATDVFLEVKEFARRHETPEVFAFDPYPAIRAKINDAQDQLHPLKGRMCGIVLANPPNAVVLLEPIFVFGAILGDVGIAFPFNAATRRFVGSGRRLEFTSGGEMVRWKSGRAVAPQNATISAICALDALPEGSRRLKTKITQWERGTGRPATLDNVLAIARGAKATNADPSVYRLRLVVYENPDAVAPLTELFGRGPFDERYAIRAGYITRLFVGPSLSSLEAEEALIAAE